MIKRIATLFLALVTAASMIALAGCGGDKGGNKGQTGGKKGGMDNTEETYFMDMPSELKGTKVQFATWIPHKTTDTGEVIANFEQTTGMTLELVEVNQTEYVVKMAALINAGQSPDVVVENGDFPRTLNLLMPLTKEETGLDVTDPFWNQEVVKIFTVGKYPYLVDGARSCWNMAGDMVYFNKTVLAENGVTDPNAYVEQNNWNLETFKTMMRQIQQSCGYKNPGTQVTEKAICKMFGGQQTSWDPATSTFSNVLTSDGNVGAYRWMLDCKSEGIMQIVTDWGSALGNGSAAVSVCGAYGLRNKPGWFYEMDFDDLGFEVLPKVKADDADYPYTFSLRAYGICKGAKNPKGAAYFLRWFLNEDNYDLNAVFKNKEAVDMYQKLRSNAKYQDADFSRGVRMTLYAEAHDGSMAKDVLNGTSAQVSVNLASASNTVQACVDKANELVKDVINNQ